MSSVKTVAYEVLTETLTTWDATGKITRHLKSYWFPLLVPCSRASWLKHLREILFLFRHLSPQEEICSCLLVCLYSHQGQRSILYTENTLKMQSISLMLFLSCILLCPTVCTVKQLKSVSTVRILVHISPVKEKLDVFNMQIFLKHNKKTCNSFKTRLRLQLEDQRGCT